ncbi:MAG: arsenite S-adenosylmethyltransferase [Nitrospira bacterium SG8_35_4]|nr:MAG: arsenite S-adenosylmethyltransferase [Nitrospira bacterium SG8_35_4]
MKNEETKKIVREGYAKVATQGSSCCGAVSSCCGTADEAKHISKKIGYTDEELKAVPEGANLGLGCGNPVAIASLKEGETVLDLGSGPGLDCFLAADKVGRNGKVIGVDMTPEMIEKARGNARKGNYSNVEFRLGEIENLPVADNSVDAVISNCVINLSPDKESVFKETFRVLKPGGRIMISDVVLSKELPDFIKDSADAYIGCISGAITRDEYMETVKAAGFQDISIVGELSVPVEEWVHDPVADSITERLGVSTEELKEVLGSVKSIKVKGFKK